MVLHCGRRWQFSSRVGAAMLRWMALAGLLNVPPMLFADARPRLGVTLATALLVWLGAAPITHGAPQAVPTGPGGLTAPADPTTIVGGRTTDPGDWDGVVAIVAGGGLCTGTVVADRLILTAAHCLADLGEGAEDKISVYYGGSIQANPAVTVTEYGWHPNFCSSCKEDIYDYGYVVIDSDFKVGGGVILPVASQEEWDEAMVAGREVTLVGYGEDPEAGGINAGIGIQRQVTTTIRRLSARGLEFYAGGMQQDSCKGDSGGPAFVKLSNGDVRLVGITSRGSEPCGEGGYYSAPYPALCWVRDRTAVDLIGPECQLCDCIDTAPPDDDGCTVAAKADDETPLGWLAAVAIVLHLGRRRRPSAAVSSTSSSPSSSSHSP